MAVAVVVIVIEIDTSGIESHSNATKVTKVQQLTRLVRIDKTRNGRRACGASSRIAFFLFSSKSRLKTGRLTAYNIRVCNEFSPKIAIYSIQWRKRKVCVWCFAQYSKSALSLHTAHCVCVLVRMAMLAHCVFAIVLARVRVCNADVNRTGWLITRFLYSAICSVVFVFGVVAAKCIIAKSNQIVHKMKKKTKVNGILETCFLFSSFDSICYIYYISLF